MKYPNTFNNTSNTVHAYKVLQNILFISIMKIVSFEMLFYFSSDVIYASALISAGLLAIEGNVSSKGGSEPFSNFMSS